MSNTQAKVSLELQPKNLPVQQTRSNTRFDDAEYQRWNENLRNRNGSKNK
jgi:hypothetical protein